MIEEGLRIYSIGIAMGHLAASVHSMMRALMESRGFDLEL